MQEQITYLQQIFTDAEVFPSVDKDFICVRTVIGTSNFGKNDKGEPVIVPITDTNKYHIDAVKLKMLSHG